MGVMKEIATRMATDPNLVGNDPESKVMRTSVRPGRRSRRLRRSATPARPVKNKRERRRKHRASVLSTFTLSFGSYRDVPLQSIPIDYLRWMLTAKNIPAADRWAAERYLRAAAGDGRHQGAA